MSTWGQYKRKLRKQAAHGLVPCPDCGGDIREQSSACQMCGGAGQAPDAAGPNGKPRYQHEMCPMCQGSGKGPSRFQCAGCGRQWEDNEQALKEIMPGGIPCPQCGSDMYEQHNSPLFKDGAWECSNQQCWHMMPLNDVVPDQLPEHWGAYQHPLGPDHGINDCGLCGADMGGGMAGYDSQLQHAICMNCWRQQHPEGLSPHPNLGVEIPPIGHPLNQAEPNDPRWSSVSPELSDAADKLYAEAFRRAQADGRSDGAYQSMLRSLQMWPNLRLSFDQAKEVADHWKAKYDSMFIGPDVNLGIPNDPRWS